MIVWICLYSFSILFIFAIDAVRVIVYNNENGNAELQVIHRSTLILLTTVRYHYYCYATFLLCKYLRNNNNITTLSLGVTELWYRYRKSTLFVSYFNIKMMSLITFWRWNNVEKSANVSDNFKWYILNNFLLQINEEIMG